MSAWKCVSLLVTCVTRTHSAETMWNRTISAQIAKQVRIDFFRSVNDPWWLFVTYFETMHSCGFVGPLYPSFCVTLFVVSLANRFVAVFKHSAKTRREKTGANFFILMNLQDAYIAVCAKISHKSMMVNLPQRIRFFSSKVSSFIALFRQSDHLLSSICRSNFVTWLQGSTWCRMSLECTELIIASEMDT